MAQEIAKGGNSPVPTSKLVIVTKHSGPDADFSALLIAASGKVRDDNDFICYAQPTHPDGSTTYGNKANNGGVYSQEVSVNLPGVAAAIDKIKLTLTIDPETPATFAAVKNCEVIVFEDKGGTRTEVARMKPEGTTENAFIVAELYRYQGNWKLRHVAQGFNNGLAGIATAFGVDVGEDTPATPTPAPAPKVNLSKIDKVTADLEKKGSRLVNLQKAAAVSLKKNNLDNVLARVMMVLDASGSTSRMWPDIMQAVLDRLATLALNLDDNGELEFWGYASSPKKYPNVTLQYLDGYIAAIQTLDKKGGLFGSWDILAGLGCGNNEPPAMREVLAEARKTPKIPTLCIFVTDGGIDKGREIQKILIEASEHPVFWQFVGLGGSGYGILEQFDSMTGRKVDNAGFFAIDDYRSVSDAELYDRIVKEFPIWLQAARRLGVIQA